MPYSEFSHLYSDSGDEVIAPPKIKEVPATELDDPLSAFHTKRAKGNVAAKVMEAAFVNDILGPTSAPETVFPKGHCAIEQFNKMFRTEVDPQVTLQLEVLRKSGRAGWYAYKQVEKAGSVPEGMRIATELFENKATPEQKRLLEKAIAACDISAWFEIFTQIFAKG
jgi:hypothetical protein